MNHRYKRCAIGGTFDRLHKGHKHFIQQAFKYGSKVIIGLTSDAFAARKRDLRFKIYDLRIQNYKERKGELERFLRGEKLYDRAEIIEINDAYGDTLKHDDIEALVVTSDSLGGGSEINRKRQEMGLKPIRIIEVPLVFSDDQKTISSTRIRLGEIDRWGKVFANHDIFGRKIPEKLRLKLKKPLGILIKRFTIYDLRFKNIKKVCVIAVGDEITKFLNESGTQADISIIDFYIKRVKVHKKIEELGFREKYKLLKARNPAGHITDETVFAVKKAIQGFIKDRIKRVIQVDGEEDLTALPSILLAPLGSIVLYGQPDLGVVAVGVTEEKKKELIKMINACLPARQG